MPKIVYAQIIREGTWTLHYTIGDVITGPVRMGDKVESHRGEKYTVTGGQPPRHGGSTGRVYVTERAGKHGYTAEFYPSVIGCKWVEDCQSCG
jgi:hypothetical protein